MFCFNFIGILQLETVSGLVWVQCSIIAQLPSLTAVLKMMLTGVQTADNVHTVWDDTGETKVKQSVTFSDEEIKIMFNYIDKSDDDKVSVKEFKKYMVSGKCGRIIGQEPVHIFFSIFIRDVNNTELIYVTILFTISNIIEVNPVFS